MKIPVFFPVTREFGFRDEFAADSPLQRRVTCEPEAPRALPPRRPTVLTNGRLETLLSLPRDRVTF